MGSPRHPALYEINTRIWLGEISRERGRPATLDAVPDETLDRIAELGFDWVWLLGVWRTGTAGRAVSLAHPDWRKDFQEALPDLTDGDICGSPFAIQGYRAHPDFGGDEALRRFRGRLRDRGMSLLLDFVPNHTALDHPWVNDRPEFYIRGRPEDLAREPGNYRELRTSRGPIVLAHGRDPYFPGWPDTLQLNYRHPALREAMKREMVRAAEACDGLRCDMAMLVLPDVFARTWGDASRPADGDEPVDDPFWPEAIAQLRDRFPNVLLMAEAYWDLEWTLQQQGFDLTYDKRLYDRLHSRDAVAVRGHLHADPNYQRRSARFLENHDEPRAAFAFPPEIHPAAATVTFLVPGLRFFHEGELSGRRVRASVHLARRPDEPNDPALQEYYSRLLDCLRRPEVRQGDWQTLNCRPAWEGNPTWDRFLSFLWQAEGQRLLVAVNYGPTRGQCYVELPGEGLRGRTFILQDLLGPSRYERDGDELSMRGLFLDMPEWGYHAFEIAPV